MASDRDRDTSGGRVLPLAPARTAAGRCPICGKPARKESRPFCSRRCADIDLGQWLDGRYRIPTNETPDDLNAERDEGEEA